MVRLDDAPVASDAGDAVARRSSVSTSAPPGPRPRCSTPPPAPSWRASTGGPRATRSRRPRPSWRRSSRWRRTRSSPSGSPARAATPRPRSVRAAFPDLGGRLTVQNEIVAHATAAAGLDPDGGAQPVGRRDRRPGRQVHPSPDGHVVEPTSTRCAAPAPARSSRSRRCPRRGRHRRVQSAGGAERRARPTSVRPVRCSSPTSLPRPRRRLRRARPVRRLPALRDRNYTTGCSASAACWTGCSSRASRPPTRRSRARWRPSSSAT